MLEVLIRPCSLQQILREEQGLLLLAAAKPAGLEIAWTSFQKKQLIDFKTTKKSGLAGEPLLVGQLLLFNRCPNIDSNPMLPLL